MEKNCIRQRIGNDHHQLFLIWLEDAKNRQLLEQFLVRIGIQFQICDSGDQCYELLENLSTNDKVSLILDGSLCDTLIVTVHSLVQLESIYIICRDDSQLFRLEYFKAKFDKIKHIMVNVLPFCTELKRLDSVIHDFTVLSSETKEINNNQEVSFIFARLVRDVFLSVESHEEERCEFMNLYIVEDAVVWYTRPIFLYGLLNRALRSQNMLMLLHFRFFIRDLYRQLCGLHVDFQASLSNPITVYRGQGMTYNDFDKLIKNNVESLLSIMTFWSTSRNTIVAEVFVIFHSLIFLI